MEELPKFEDKEMQFVIFEVSGEEFCIEVENVEEITRLKDITRIPNADKNIEGVINLRGRIHILTSLAKKLDLQVNEPTEETRIIVVDKGDERVGLIVDKVIEVMRIGESKIKKTPEVTKLDAKFLKNVVMIDKRLIMVLDLSEIV